MSQLSLESYIESRRGGWIVMNEENNILLETEVNQTGIIVIVNIFLNVQDDYEDRIAENLDLIARR